MSKPTRVVIPMRFRSIQSEDSAAWLDRYLGDVVIPMRFRSIQSAQLQGDGARTCLGKVVIPMRFRSIQRVKSSVWTSALKFAKGRNPYEIQVNTKCYGSQYHSKAEYVVVIPMRFRSIQSLQISQFDGPLFFGRNPYEIQVNTKTKPAGPTA